MACKVDSNRVGDYNSLVAYKALEFELDNPGALQTTEGFRSFLDSLHATAKEMIGEENAAAVVASAPNMIKTNMMGKAQDLFSMEVIDSYINTFKNKLEVNDQGLTLNVGKTKDYSAFLKKQFKLNNQTISETPTNPKPEVIKKQKTETQQKNKSAEKVIKETKKNPPKADTKPKKKSKSVKHSDDGKQITIDFSDAGERPAPEFKATPRKKYEGKDLKQEILHLERQIAEIESQAGEKSQAEIVIENWKPISSTDAAKQTGLKTGPKGDIHSSLVSKDGISVARAAELLIEELGPESGSGETLTLDEAEAVDLIIDVLSAGTKQKALKNLVPENENVEALKAELKEYSDELLRLESPNTKPTAKASEKEVTATTQEDINSGFQAKTLTVLRTSGNQLDENGMVDPKKDFIYRSFTRLNKKTHKVRLTSYKSLSDEIKNTLAYNNYTDDTIVALVVDENNNYVRFSSNYSRSKDGKGIAYILPQNDIAQKYNYNELGISEKIRNVEDRNELLSTTDSVNEIKAEVERMNSIIEYVKAGNSLVADILSGSKGVLQTEFTDTPLAVESIDLESSDIEISTKSRNSAGIVIKEPHVIVSRDTSNRTEMYVPIKGKYLKDMPEQLDLIEEILSTQTVDGRDITGYQAYDHLYSVLGKKFTLKYGMDTYNGIITFSRTSLEGPELAAEVLKDIKENNLRIVVNHASRHNEFYTKAFTKGPDGRYMIQEYSTTGKSFYSERGVFEFSQGGKTGTFKANQEIDGVKSIRAVNNTLAFSVEGDMNTIPDIVVDETVAQEVEEEITATPESIIEDPFEDFNPDTADGLSEEDFDLFRNKMNDAGATKAEIDAAWDWWNNSPLSKQIPVSKMFDIVNSDAYAQWNVSGITLFNGSTSVDLYHEAWHAFTQLYLTKDQKKELYDSIRKRSGSFVDFKGNLVSYSSASWIQLEEKLAEEFREFARSGGKSFPKDKKQKNIFQRIWDMLRSLVGSKNYNGSTQIENELFTNLYKGRINSYTYSTTNLTINKLNKSTALRSGAGKISYTDSLQMASSLDYMISHMIKTVATKQNSSAVTDRVFGSKERLLVAYKNAKKMIAKKVYDLELRKKDGLSKDPVRLERAIQLNKVLLNELGTEEEIKKNIEAISKGKKVDNIIGFHLENSAFELGDVDELYKYNDADAVSDEISDGKNPGDNNIENETPDNQFERIEIPVSEQLAPVLKFVMSSLTKKDVTDNGIRNSVNEMGFDNLYRLSEVVETVQRITEGMDNIDDMMAALKANMEDKPFIKEMLALLGDVDASDKWSNFFEAFSNARLPMVNVMAHIKAGKLERTTVQDSPGDTQNIQKSISSEFRTKKSKYKNKDEQGNYLNIEAVLQGFNYYDLNAFKASTFKPEKAYEFLKAIGVITPKYQTKALKDSMVQIGKDLGAEFIYTKLQAINYYNKKALAQGKELIIIRDVMDDLIKMNHSIYMKVAKSESQKNVIDNNGVLYIPGETGAVIPGIKPWGVTGAMKSHNLKILFDTIRKTASTSSTSMLADAKGSKQLEHVKHSTLTKVIELINGAETFDELVQDSEWNYLAGPMAKHSKLLAAAFDFENGGKRRLTSRGLPVKLDLVTLGGTTNLRDGVANQKLH
jgi:hypothetical protein